MLTSHLCNNKDQEHDEMQDLSCSPSVILNNGNSSGKSDKMGKVYDTIQICVIPLRRVSVQLRRTSAGRLASSKAKGPALGFRSPSTAVMLIALGLGLSHTSVSWGKTRGALSLISNR